LDPPPAAPPLPDKCEELEHLLSFEIYFDSTSYGICTVALIKVVMQLNALAGFRTFCNHFVVCMLSE